MYKDKYISVGLLVVFLLYSESQT